MTQNYELIVKGIRNFENKVTVTLALRDKKRFDGEIFDLDISLDRVEGAALEFYEAAARRSIRQVFLDVAAGLCEGDELLPETRPCSEARYTIKINSSDNSITGCYLFAVGFPVSFIGSILINIHERKNQIRPVSCGSGADCCRRVCSSNT
ncbi:DUF1327 domain-containing protein [Escherichia coli]|nr:DUF1327 domain-containing protein [Escherichia coli]